MNVSVRHTKSNLDTEVIKSVSSSFDCNPSMFQFKKFKEKELVPIFSILPLASLSIASLLPLFPYC